MQFLYGVSNQRKWAKSLVLLVQVLYNIQIAALVTIQYDILLIFLDPIHTILGYSDEWIATWVIELESASVRTTTQHAGSIHSGLRALHNNENKEHIVLSNKI